MAEEYGLGEGTRGNLPEKEFRVMRVKIIQDFGKEMEAQTEKIQQMFNKNWRI